MAKVNAAGTALLYAGYIGGFGFRDLGLGIAVDNAGNAYVTGVTDSTEATFPVTVGPDLTFNGGGEDAFVAKVNAAGTALLYAGYIGGEGLDEGLGIAVDGAGNAYVTGSTLSTEATFPATVGPDLTHNGSSDAFVAKVKADGTALLYAGYIGGNGDDVGSGIAVDSVGNAYVTGFTLSTEATFPVTIGPDLTHNGGFYDAFVAKVKADGTALLYAGYIGGNDGDFGLGIAVDSAGNAYVTGDTFSTEATFPVTIGPDLTHNGGRDAFVAKVNAAGTALLYAGYIGGNNDDGGDGIAVDGAGNAYVIGTTFSTEATFPVTVGPDLTFNGVGDAFVAKVNAAGTALLYAGYIGGDDFDEGRGIAVDSAGNAYVTGFTESTEATFLVTVGPDLTHNGLRDAFVAKIAARPLPAIGTFIGTFRPSTGQWFLDFNGNSRWDGCTVDGCRGPFGAPTDLPVVGDWDGDGIDQIGVFRPASGLWFLDLNGNGRWDSCGVDGCRGPFGASTDRPVAGDWDGDGIDEIGVFRPASGLWFLDLNGNSRWDDCTVDGCRGPFGTSTDLPVAGDWDGDDSDEIGVFRAGSWFLDLNGNVRWDGCGVDGCRGPFGAPTDRPVAGVW